MGLISRISSRMREEGYAKTFQYGFLVGADAIKGYLLDTRMDLRYSGRVLHGNKTSCFKHLGANDVYHTDYCIMPLIFSIVDIRPDDVLVDIGCGKGRIINYWLSQNYRNKIIGLEIDPDIAASTACQFASRPNVKIVQGDAVENLPGEGTVFYFYNPFSKNKVLAFEQKVREITGDKQVRIIYYNPKSLAVFGNSRWHTEKFNFERDFGIRRWGRLNKYHELAILTKTADK